MKKTDINSLIGLLLIGGILIWFTYQNKPEETAQPAPTPVDSTESVIEKPMAEVEMEGMVVDSLPDSLKLLEAQKKYGVFAYGSLDANEEKISLENDVLRADFSTLGGNIVEAELKAYQTYDSLPLILFTEDSSKFDVKFWAQGRVYNTGDLVFKPRLSRQGEYQVLEMRLEASANSHFTIRHQLKDGDHHISTSLISQGMDEVFLPNSDLNIDWTQRAPRLEKSAENEGANSTIYYAFDKEEVEDLSLTGEDEETAKLVEWVGLRNQFFVSVIRPKSSFERIDMVTEPIEGSEDYVKNFQVNADLLVENSANLTSWDMYFLPNHFNTLKEYDLGFQRMVPLGWAIFRWINRGIVIPTFNILDSWHWNYGLIIFVMALLIKMILFPLTYKSYMSMAKMRVLKPEIDEITEKQKDPMKKQQAMMALYRQAGANPLGGCLPMLLQMPILFAMFRFFPSSFELRQEPFLWAEDLSTYDSVWTFGEVPIINSIYGDHVSLFTLLMTISTIIYTRSNQQMSMSGPQAQQMKVMMYIMPLMFLGFLNNYAAGLSYYYLVANIITFGQQYAIRRFVDDEAILAKIEANKKKPKKKSKFQQRLEEAAKQRGYKGK